MIYPQNAYNVHTSIAFIQYIGDRSPYKRSYSVSVYLFTKAITLTRYAKHRDLSLLKVLNLFQKQWE